MKKTVATIFFLWLCCTLFGCKDYVWIGPRAINEVDPSTVAYVCLSIPDEEIAEASEAVRLWDKSLHNWRRFIPIKSSDKDGCSYWITEVNHGREDDVNAIAWVSKVGGRTIYLLKGSYEHSTRKIVLHELGHSLGAQHIKGTLMHPVAGKEMAACPDMITVSQVAAWNNLDLSSLEWCEKS